MLDKKLISEIKIKSLNGIAINFCEFNENKVKNIKDSSKFYFTGDKIKTFNIYNKFEVNEEDKIVFKTEVYMEKSYTKTLIGSNFVEYSDEEWEDIFEEIYNKNNSCILSNDFINRCIEYNLNVIEDNLDDPFIFLYRKDNVFLMNSEYNLVGIIGDCKFTTNENDSLIKLNCSNYIMDSLSFNNTPSFIALNIYDDIYIVMEIEQEISFNSHFKKIFINKNTVEVSEISYIDKKIDPDDIIRDSIDNVFAVYDCPEEIFNSKDKPSRMLLKYKKLFERKVSIFNRILN